MSDQSESAPLAHFTMWRDGTIEQNFPLSQHLPVPANRQFRFTVIEVDGVYQVQDTWNGDKSCFNTRNKKVAQEQAGHLQQRINGLRTRINQSTRHSQKETATMTASPNGVQVGDRIRLSAPMENDPCPIEVGDEGIVTRITDFRRWAILTGEWQIGVEWVSGRSLMLAVPPDKFVIVKPGKCRLCGQDVWSTARGDYLNAEGETFCDDGEQSPVHELLVEDADLDDRCDYCGLKLGACDYMGLMHAVSAS